MVELKKIQTMMVGIMFLLLGIATSCSDGDEAILPEQASAKMPATEVVVNKDSCMQLFSQILSKAVSQRQDVRMFLKAQALKKFDNDFNVFYPFVKNEKIGERTFKDVLSDYEKNEGDLDNIEKTVPLLNIHIPEIGDQKVERLNVADDEIPVLLGNKLYYEGNVVDSLGVDEVPGFNLFVVCESSTIREKNAFTRSISDCSIDGKYEYVDKTFNPKYVNEKTLTRSSVEYDNLDEKYTERGYIPKGDIDPLLIDAFNNSKNQQRATRYMMYYGLSNVSQTPTAMKPDIKDCIFRFKISQNAFSRFEDIAEGDNKPLFNKSQSQQKAPMTREQALQRLLTGRAFCFLFKFEGNVNGNTVTSEDMKIYAKPDQLFNLRIVESKSHKTMFRHSKYTYTIDKNGIKSKWFYPLDYGQDTRLNTWDVSKDPIEKKVIVYLINPDEGFTKDVTENYSVTYISGGEIGGNLSIPIDKIDLGINGKLTSSKTTTKNVTYTYKITQSNERIDEFQFNYFDDYPIESVVRGNYVVPIRKGRGVIETSILPISNKFYTQKRFQ